MTEELKPECRKKKRVIPLQLLLFKNAKMCTNVLLMIAA